MHSWSINVKPAQSVQDCFDFQHLANKINVKTIKRAAEWTLEAKMTQNNPNKTLKHLGDGARRRNPSCIIHRETNALHKLNTTRVLTAWKPLIKPIINGIIFSAQSAHSHV